MDCNEVAAILDDHRVARLTPAERCAVDQHVQGCADCAAAWHADTALHGLWIPLAPASLPERVQSAIASLAARPAAQPRRARSAWLIGGLVAAGAALAATALVTLTRSTDEALPDESVVPSTAPVAVDAGAESPNVDAAPPQSAPRATSVELVEIALAIAPIVRRSPDYPLEALKQRLEGHVQLKFDVTAGGIVENVRVVESSDAQFEDPAVRALSEWRYLPRIVAGKRVAEKDIVTIIRFALGSDKGPPPDQRQVDAKREAAAREFAAFSGGLEIALDRLAADDLRGTELQLDEMYAIYDNDGNRATLWNFYGYLYTVDGNYDRAIDAYEAGIAASARAGRPSDGRWVPLANLYFARHQYDMALRTLLTYNERLAELRAQQPERTARSVPEVDSFIERLRALGVTEETLPRRR